MKSGSSRLLQLLAAAKEGSSDKRRDVLEGVADVFLAAPDRHTHAEMQHFDAILSLVARQAEEPARRALAEKLAGVRRAPERLVRQLARDEISVAEPLLMGSKSLGEGELIGIVSTGDEPHREAIARRAQLGPKLTAALAEHAGEAALVSVAENQDAKFDDETMEKMVAHARSYAALQRPMTERFDLPAPLLTKMYFFVTSSLKREILDRADMLDPALIMGAVTANRKTTLNPETPDTRPDMNRARKLIASKISVGGVNETLLNELIEQRRAAAFLLAFSYVMGVNPSTAQLMLKDKSWQPLAIACRATGMARETFVKIVYGLQRDGHQQSKALRILDIYQKIPEDAADRMMRFWRVRATAAAPIAELDGATGAGDPATPDRAAS